MQQRIDINRRVIANNLMWLVGSFALAFFVWVVATLDSDPIMENNFRNIPIRVEHDPNLIITGQSTSVATVLVRAPQSTLQQLDSDDIQVIADLSQFGPGEHLVNLEATVSRRSQADTAPRRIMIDLEAAQEKLVPVETVITEAPPRGFEIQGGSPIPENNQVLVSGPQSVIERVVSARIILNLSQRRNPFTDALRLLPVDADGNTVENVTVEPDTMPVNVPIQARSDIRQVSVTPNILADTLPAGYALTSIEYEPQVLLISGPADALETAPGTLFTELLDLTDRTASFQVTATVQLPNERLFVLGDQTVNVSIGIAPLLASRQFDRVPVEIIGVDPAFDAALSPAEVTVLMTGPQILLDALEARELRAVIDLNGLGEGNYQRTPDLLMNIDQTVLTNLSVLPTEIEVVIYPAQADTPLPAATATDTSGR